ncbi:MAG TPA: IPTL-CTERM sorting domain-containing protein [Usitatibacter sp.]|nr:IPTL-CTERM sorting domain-containing protein [Usitatibacter sp.]
MSWRNLAAILAAAFLSVISLPSAAQILYGATGGLNGGVATGNLYILDQTTGAASVVGPIGYSVTGMAFQNGIMYGATTNNAACSSCLIRINLYTGAGTVIGPLGLTISELEFGPGGKLFGWSESSDEFASINLTTGAATTIPGSGISTYGDGLAFLAGTMYVMPQGANSTYYSVNTTTGAVTPLGTLTGNPLPAGAAVNAAAVQPGTSAVFASVNDFGAASNLVTVNLFNGVITNVGTTVTGLDALSFGPAAGIPTLSQWSLLGLMLLVGFVGMRGSRGLAQVPRA